MEAFVPLPSREYSLKASVLASADELVETRAVELENLQGLNKCQSGTEARALLESVLNSENSLYNSLRIMPGASEKGISDADLAIQTKIRNNRYSIMELIELNGDKDADRASLSLLCLLVASTISAMVANQIFPGPEIVRFALVWALCFAPLGFVGYGIATPEKLQALLVSMQREVFPVYRKRMIQHEAGHLLMGHLLGLPVKGYTSNAVKNAVEFYPLNDPDVGRVRAQQLGFDNTLIPRTEDNTESKSARQETFPFFSNEGRGASLLEDQSVFRKSKNYRENPFLKLPSLNEPKYSWPFRGFDDLSIDKLTVVSVAGVCAEILAFGNAEGGYADLSQLQQIFNSAQSDLTERDKENRVRWALGYTVSQLRLHLGALDDLADAMERGSTLAECIYAIESCKNVAGGDGVMGEYDRRRREKFRHEGVGLLEKIFLGGKNADTEESRLIRGKGGGDKRQSFVLSGDDPFYAALGVALVFCLWACNGGLTLH
jgi:hypothetical protein